MFYSIRVIETINLRLSSYRGASRLFPQRGIWEPLKILGWQTKNRIPSFIMLLPNIGYLKNMAKKTGLHYMPS